MGVTHFIAGLLEDNGGIAARAIRRLEVESASVYQALGVGRASGGYDADPPPCGNFSSLRRAGPRSKVH